MALSSTCPKCNSTRFENSGETKITGYKYKLNLIQCAKCGAVVGVVPAVDPSAAYEITKKTLDDLKEQIERLQQTVAALASRRQ